MQAMQTALNEELEEKKARNTDNDFKMVAFSLGGKDYAIDILKVKEIASADRFTYVPNTSAYVVGVYNLRGEIIPVIDLRTFFNVEKLEKETKSTKNENMIIVNLGDRRYGTIVEQIEKVVSVNSASIQPPHPLFGDINIKYISGIVEHVDNMYILLDIERIFGLESTDMYEKSEMHVVKNKEPVVTNTAKSDDAPVSAPKLVTVETEKPVVTKAAAPIVKPPVTEVPVVVEPVVAKKEVLDYKFVTDILQKHQNFHVSSINDAWVKERFEEWKIKKGDDATLSDATDVDNFLSTFNSPCTNRFWTKDYADAVYATLPENTAKQINVWNAGCGSGYEAYSLACLLRKKYPDARIKIYAHDTDLILISSATILRVTDDMEGSWYQADLTRSVSGDLVFDSTINESILFEYHDCSNLNTVPMVDIIFSRDVLSYNPADKVEKMLVDFHEYLKDNGLLIIGANESISDNPSWRENSTGNVVVYNKN